MKRFILLSTILSLLSISCFAQTKQEIETPYNCDAMLGIFDSAVAAASTEQNKESLVIIVAYLGRREKSGKLNQQRLSALKYYLTNKRGFPEERLILTEGKKRSGLGKIEFYVSGKLANELFLINKARVCTGCCPSEFET